MHKIPAYKSDLFRVGMVSIFFAFKPAILGNITILIAPGKNKKIFPTIWAKEYKPESWGRKKYFTKIISKLTKLVKDRELIATGSR